MTKLFLHIGYPKTATTAIQDNLILNQKLLLEKGVLYPANGLDIKAHHIIPRIMRKEGLKSHSNDLEIISEGLQYELNSYKPEACIISSEGFVFGTNPHEVMAYFKSIFQHIEILIYLRNPYDWIESDYNQGVKAHRNITSTFDEFVEHILNIRTSPLAFDKVVRKWADVFSFRKMHVRAYQGKNQDIISDFLETIGMKKPEEWKKPGIVDSNPRLSFNDVEFLRMVNYLNLELNEKKKLLEFCRPIHRHEDRVSTFWLSNTVIQRLSKLTKENKKLKKKIMKKDQKIYNEMLESSNFNKTTRFQNQNLEVLSYYFETLLRNQLSAKKSESKKEWEMAD
ncbi:hypothetical protein [Desulfotignum balticum]|uniref:hypothetical protein n=1 Tax=Desulfotignum balticum TaxID=115781 RepID=UPI00041F053E|nr:hypothetical protein [Desulfotignum balticum]